MYKVDIIILAKCQAKIVQRLNSVVACYNGSIEVYEDNIIRVYDEGAGRYYGKNRMGANMVWPN
jgi:hypothetical protein